MIATGIFLFLLGTKLGQTSAAQSDVTYEPSRITIREQINQSPVLIPELGPPPYLSNFIHQGSNYFFGMPFPLPPRNLGAELPARATERVATEVIKEKDCKNVKIAPKPEITEVFVGKEKPFRNSFIEVNADEVIQKPKLSLPIPNISLNLQPIPNLPSIPIPIVNSQLVSQPPLPLQSINIPGLPLLKSSKVPKVPMLIEIPARRKSGDYIISEADVQVKRIPPPPELPPLILEEFVKPVIVEEKKVILVPSPPDFQAILPPSIVTASNSCPPTLCAQNIVFERILPNIVCEKSQMVELISIPATKRVPVVTSSMFRFVKK